MSESGEISNVSTTSETASPAKEKAPKSLYAIFLYFGVTSLLPFNAFITPDDFWGVFYAYNPSFMNYISFCYNIPAVFMALVMAFWGNKWPIVPRIVISLSFFFAGLIFLPFIHSFFGIDAETAKTIDSNAACDVVTLLFILLSGIANGIFFPTIIQIATQFDGVYSQAMMEGNGIGGIIPVLINIITKLCLDDTQTVTEIYFAIAAIVVVIAFFLFFFLYRIKYSSEVMQQLAPLKMCKGSYQSIEEREDSDGLIEESNHKSTTDKKESRPLDDDEVKTTDTSGSNMLESRSTDNCALEGSSKDGKQEKTHSKSFIFKKLLFPEISILLIFAVTLSLFPGTTLYMYFTEPLSDEWWSVFIVGIFNLVDWIGRSLPKYQIFQRAKWLSDIRALFGYSVGRLIFVPLIVIPAVGLFTSTAYTVIIMILFAFTNGFISSMLMMEAPFLLTHPEDRKMAGTLMTIMLNTGLSLGSTLNLAFAELPFQKYAH